MVFPILEVVIGAETNQSFFGIQFTNMIITWTKRDVKCKLVLHIVHGFPHI